MYPIDVIYADINSFLTSADIADTTKELYSYFLRTFFSWTIPQKIDPEAVTPLMVNIWFKANVNWSASTRHNAAAALREFYKWRYGESHTVCTIKVKRSDAGPQRTLDERELIALLSSIDTTTIKGIRDLAIATLMADTGMRATEVCRLETRYLELKSRKLRVLVKGGDYNVKYFFEYTANCLAQWMSVRKEVAQSSCPTVFVAVGGKKPGTTMTRYGIRTIFVELGLTANIEHLTPHAMRRTFATIATENGAPTRMVQAAGGWKSIRMVELYTRAVKAEKMQPYSPVNKVMGVVAPQAE